MYKLKNNSVEYLISKSILKELLKDNLIMETELANIDEENKKSFNK